MINGVRQFKLINRTGAEYDMTRPERLFHNPDGLGWGTEREIRRIGMTYFADDEKEIHQRPTGEMVFRTYAEYAAFLSFCQVGGLVLAYKPRETWYYAKCLISINKSEIKVDTLHLVCPVKFTLTSYWYERVVAETATPEDPAEPTYISLSGETVSFAGAYEYPLANLEVEIQGSQDLNGYSKPWAGGVGKNLLDPKLYGGIPYNAAIGRQLNIVDTPYSFTKDGDVFSVTLSSSWTQVGMVVDVSAYTGKLNTTAILDSTDVGGFSAYLLDTDYKVLDRRVSNSIPNNINATFDLDTYNTAKYFVFGITNRGGRGATLTLTRPQLEKGSAATSWEPYENIAPITAYNTVTITQTGNDETKTYDVELTGAGNVYKGTLNVTTGELTVTHVSIAIPSIIPWVKSTSFPGGFYYSTGTNIYMPFKNNTPLLACSHRTIAETLSQYEVGTAYVDGSVNIRIMPAAATVQDWKDYIDAQATRGTPITIAGELAEPLTYQLTPTEIKNLIGNQVISANSGGIIDATVRTDGPNVYKIYPYRYSYQYGAGISNVFDFDLDLPSYFKLTIFGEINNPSWRLLVNGEIVKTGAMLNLNVSSTQKFVLNTNPKEMEIRIYSNRDVRVGSVYGKSNFTTERIFELPKGRSQLQIMTDDENIPKVMIEVLKHV